MNMDYDVKLIEEVKKYPELYDSSHRNFKNKEIKAALWKDIAFKMRKQTDEYSGKSFMMPIADFFLFCCWFTAFSGEGKTVLFCCSVPLYYREGLWDHGTCALRVESFSLLYNDDGTT